MSAPSRVACDVGVPDSVVKAGEFANAFRVLPGSGEDVFLDFCVYSAATKVAIVVSRIRVHREFLPLVGGRILESLVEIRDQDRIDEDVH